MSSHLFQFFLADSETRTDEAEPNLLWKVVLRTGTWKLRPGPGGVKLKAPLHILRDKAPKGHVSMAALKEAFDAKAKENVTFPAVHADGTTSDSGFVRKLVIEDVKDGDKVTESKLWAGIEVTDSDIKKKIDEKSLVGVSGGILFDYERTEDGKKFPQILSHVMSTNSPWINGTGGFTTKLPAGVMAADDVNVPLGELEPDAAPPELGEDDSKFIASFKRMLGLDHAAVVPPAPATDPVELDVDPDKKPPADKGSVVWKPEEGYQIVRGRIQKALEDQRRALLNMRVPGDYSIDYPYYHVDDISGSGNTRKALIMSGYGSDRDAWVATAKLTDDGVEIEPFMNWTPAKQEWVAASEDQSSHSKPPSPARPAGRSPSTLSGQSHRLSLVGVGLREAQAARAERIALGDTTTQTTPGGIRMSRVSDLIEGLGLSISEMTPEQRALVDRQIAAEQAEEEREKRAREQRKSGEADTYLSEFATALGLKAPEGETDPAKSLEPALARYVRGVLMSDDDGIAINLSFDAGDGHRTQPVQTTASDVLKGLINAMPKNAEGKITLAQQARQVPGDIKPDEHEPDPDKPVTQSEAKSRADRLVAQMSEQGLDVTGLAATTSTNGGSA